MPASKEQNTLMMVDDDGAILIMLDGSRYRVERTDFPTTITWRPSAEVEIIHSGDNSGSCKILNKDTRERVSATAP